MPSTSTSPSSVSSPPMAPRPSFFARARAWSVHFYTGLGLLINAYSLHAALYSAKPSFELFARLNWLAIFVDATDGTLARLWNVKELAPGVDGALLDNIIDFQTFSLLPALGVMVFESHLSPTYRYAIAGMVLIASGYQFCQSTAKTTSAFVGFPSYWNVLLFYVHYLKPTPVVVLGLFSGCAILSFIPVHFIYPTRTPDYFWPTMIGAYLWGILMVIPTMTPDWKYSVPCMQASLAYVLYYFVVSFILDSRRRKNEQTEALRNEARRSR